ncbi:MAG: BON domain-containing protein, partial [Caulobacteraceae bacterium]
MAEDRWDDERRGDERREDDEPRGVTRRHDGPYYSDRGWGEAPRIGSTGMGARHIGNMGTSGRYYEDHDRRAEYGGYQGGVPGWGPGLGRRRASRAEPESDRREDDERRRAMEEERRVGGPYTDYGRAFGGFGAGGGYTPDPREGVARHGRSPYDRGADEIRAFFGDADAERRLDWDSATEGPHRGRGPKGYRRSDERIREDVSDRLTDDAFVDASEVEVEVSGGEVTLNGWVASRAAKRRAEDCADSVMGVCHVQNNLRVGA